MSSAQRYDASERELPYAWVVVALAFFAFAVAFGLVDFATVPPTTALATTLFGKRSGGTAIGMVSLSHQVGSAVGSYAGGLVHDLAGSYLLFFLGGALLCAVAAAMSWAIAEVQTVQVATSES